jgi:hypothetical protein
MGSGTSYISGKTELSVNALKGMMASLYLYKEDYAKVRSLTNENDLASTCYTCGITPNIFQFLMNGAAPNSIFEWQLVLMLHYQQGHIDKD